MTCGTFTMDLSKEMTMRYGVALCTALVLASLCLMGLTCGGGGGAGGGGGGGGSTALNIVFHSNRGGPTYIYGFKESTPSNVIQWTNTPGIVGDFYPDLHRDSGLVFVRDLGDGKPAVFRLTIGGPVRVTDSSWDGACTRPKWSPDGKRIVFSFTNGNQWDVYEITLNGSEFRQITNSPFDDFAGGYSPRGLKIVFESNRDGNNEIYTCNTWSTETDVVRLTNTPHLETSPSYSRDGDRICYVSYATGNPEIWRMTFNGGNPTQITNLGGQSLAPQYLDSGTFYILFMSSVSGNFEIYRILDVSGGANLTKLTDHLGLDAFPSSAVLPD